VNVGGTVVNGLVGGFAGTISRGLTQRPSLSAWLQRITGALLLGLAARIAFDRH
jgi:threonine/homoserine/homoserine lactone efflux protein